MQGLVETVLRTEPSSQDGKNKRTNNGELIFGVDNDTYGQEHINRNGGKSK